MGGPGPGAVGGIRRGTGKDPVKACPDDAVNADSERANPA